MDPNVNLSEQKELAAKMIRDYEDPESNGIDQEEAANLAELIVALDIWIKHGGCLPKDWKP